MLARLGARPASIMIAAPLCPACDQRCVHASRSGILIVMGADGNAAHPWAFLSHASEDKPGFTEPLARELASRGIQPWLDKWEIRPGDSLIRKLFDDGLATVNAVIVVVSAFSAHKRWVREELDAAMVARITSNTRLIPIRLDEADMPAPLRHLVWIDSDRSQRGVRDAADQIADTLHQRDLRPTVANPPSYTAHGGVPGLTAAESLLLARLAERAIARGHLLPGLDWEEAVAAVEADGLPESVAAEAAHVLAHADFVVLKGTWQSRIVRIQLTHSGLGAALPVVQPDYGNIGAQIIAELINDPPADIGGLAERVSVPTVVAQHFVTELQEEGLLSYREYLGGGSRIYNISPALRRRVR